MTLYSIHNWSKHFEKARSRDVKKASWFPCPNSLDGSGFKELVDHADGPAHYAVWIILLAIASKCDPRGTLIRTNGKPHDADSISRVSGFPVALISDALQRLTDEIKWVESTPCQSTTLYNRTGQDSTNEFPNGNSCGELPKNGSTPPDVFMEFPVVGGKVWCLTRQKFDEYASTFVGVNVESELRKALQWLRDRPRNIKTPQGMPRYLSGWLSRCQDRGPRNGFQPQTKLTTEEKIRRRFTEDRHA